MCGVLPHILLYLQFRLILLATYCIGGCLAVKIRTVKIVEFVIVSCSADCALLWVPDSLQCWDMVQVVCQSSVTVFHCAVVLT